MKTTDLRSVKIGNQEWMTENLNVSTFRNGDLIQEVKTAEEWRIATSKQNSVWCYYDYNPENSKKYGKLYNWFAIKNPGGIAPEGWHIPSKDEFEVLLTECGGKGKHKYKSLLLGKSFQLHSRSQIKISKLAYESLIQGGSSNFNSLFSGFYDQSGHFNYLGTYTFYWSNTQCSNNYVWSLCIENVNKIARMLFLDKNSGFSVRVLKD